MSKADLPRADEPRPDRCETCRFWDGGAGDVTEECRRRSPIPDLKDDVATWPVTLNSDWCGEWLAKGYV